MPHVPMSAEQRIATFWSRVDRRSADECWVWLGGKVQDGYGVLWLNRKSVKTHRFSWALHRGPIPDGLCVLHRCDNRPCVNPAHLFLGTQTDNVVDRDAKGRQISGMAVHPELHPLGERCGKAKLTAEQVTAIRESRDLHIVLAARYSIHKSTVSRIKCRTAWTHVPQAMQPPEEPARADQIR